MSIKETFVRLIEKTENPTAPIAFHELYGNCDRVAKMLVPSADKAKTLEYTDRLLAKFPADGSFAGDPSFIIALAGLLSQALVEYARVK